MQTDNMDIAAVWFLFDGRRGEYGGAGMCCGSRQTKKKT